MAAKPIVDGIERVHEGKLTVIRLNIQDPAGEALLERYEFRFTPTFIFFVNDAKLVHFSYRRYLENVLRERFGFEGTALRLTFRGRKRR